MTNHHVWRLLGYLGHSAFFQPPEPQITYTVWQKLTFKAHVVCQTYSWCTNIHYIIKYHKTNINVRWISVESNQTTIQMAARGAVWWWHWHGMDNQLMRRNRSHGCIFFFYEWMLGIFMRFCDAKWSQFSTASSWFFRCGRTRKRPSMVI